MTAGTLAGLGGASATLGQPGQPPQSGPPDGAPGGPPDGPSRRACPSGTTSLATYEVDGGGFELVAGEDVATFSDVARTDDGDVVSFAWEATDVVAVVTARVGSARQHFEGGFDGHVDVSGGRSAIETVSFCAPRGGRAVLCELDMDRAYETVFHLREGPAVLTPEQIAQAKFGLSFDRLSAETAWQVQAIYNRQPLPAGTDPADVRTREEIAEAAFGIATEERDLPVDLMRAQLLTVQNHYDRQFGPLPSDPGYSLDTIAQAKYGKDFADLSVETAWQVQAIYNRQPFPAGTDPADVRTREEIAEAAFGIATQERDLPVDLTRGGIVAVQNRYDRQFGPIPRSNAVEIASSSATSDYAHAMVNVVARLPERVTLDDLTTLSFDYYEGAANANAIPDEVFVSLLTPDDDLKLAVKHVSADAPPEQWQRFDVLALAGKEWKVEDVTLADLRSSHAAVDTARRLRDDPDQRAVLTEAFGDATLAGVGIGAGNTRHRTTIERTFDDLVVGWDGDGQAARAATLDFPAVLPIEVDDVTQRGQGQLRVTLSFQGSGASVDDVAPESVKLNAFGPFVPPLEPGVSAQQVRTDGDALEARFPFQEVAAELDGTSRFIVSGDLDVPAGVSFFATGETR